MTGLSPKSIRHYEKIGLIPGTKRTEAGYRQYSEEEINQLSQIRYYRDLKFTLEEITFLMQASQEEKDEALTRQLRVIGDLINEYQYAQSIIYSTLQSRGKEEKGLSKKKGHLAVIALVLQNDMLDGGALACKRIHSILQPLTKLFNQARQRNVPVVYVCDCHKKGDPELLIWNDHMIEGTYGAQIINEVAPHEKDFIVKKNLFNGFVNTNLQETLGMLGVDTLLFTGWRTEVCVAQTAIEAYYRGYKVAIAGDGVNSRSQSEHEFGMTLMGINYDFPIYTCEEALEVLLEIT